MSKPKVLKDFDRLDPKLKQSVRKKYPLSFRKALTEITDHRGKRIKVLPFETSNKYYLLRMPDSNYHVPSQIEYDTANNEVMEIEESITAALEKPAELDTSKIED